MKKRKHEFRTYAAWNFDKEIGRYNQKSREGWHAFRKKYRAELPEEDYEIYTDSSSKNEILGRCMLLMKLFAVIIGCS